ncbi:hypothetical protein TorRG33x02_186730 [Trema orientale]|uniref:Retrovirus-related Pol polyprotein from transposon TNT 1-94-like beta-barrel domain-containing protein n=1 Tax=Trema orientale TaxID=63057 RepID=A0A2P5EJ05_TREOI|nr:hypothetical protein TorRG33x02_186730 [Trema orientale]
MTPNKHWFEEFKQIDNGQVLLGNNKGCKVVGIGTVRIKMHDGVERVLENVRYLPELKRNLISLGTLDSKGYSYKAEGGHLRVSRGCLAVIKGVKENGLYVLQGNTVNGVAATTSDDSIQKAQLWH